MLLTPTYHVFDLYKVHHDAKYLPVKFTSPDYTRGSDKIPALSVSASQDSTGVSHITLVNIDPNKSLQLQTTLSNAWQTVKGSIVVSAKVTDINTFDRPDNIRVQPFSGARKQGNQLLVELPAKSVVMLELK
jgi:alpha-N-arabinofuranosidase